MIPLPLVADLIEDEHFEDLDLRGEVLAGKEFHGCTFTRCTFAAARLERCLFDHCEVEGSDWSAVRLGNSSFRAVRFTQCRVGGVDFSAANQLMFEVRFEDCVLDFSSFVGMRLHGLQVLSSRAREADFTGTDLTGACFDGTELRGARFWRTTLHDADLRGASAYAIQPDKNRLKDTRFSLDAALDHLALLGIRVRS